MEIVDPNAPREESPTPTTIPKQKIKHKFESYNSDYYGVMYLLIGLNIIFYIVTSIMGGDIIEIGYKPLIMFGASKQALYERRYYVLITSMFVHDGLFHILFNILFITFITPKLAQLGYRYLGLFATYFVTGILGGYLTIFVQYGIGLGASGALFGWVGVYIAILRRENSPVWKNYMIYSLLYIFLAPYVPILNITFYGHLIPFLIGLFIGSLSMFDFLRQSPDSKQ